MEVLATSAVMVFPHMGTAGNKRLPRAMLGISDQHRSAGYSRGAQLKHAIAVPEVAAETTIGLHAAFKGLGGEGKASSHRTSNGPAGEKCAQWRERRFRQAFPGSR